MARDIVDDVINDAVNYSQQKKDKHKYYDKGPEIGNSDDYDEDKPLEIGQFYNMQQGHSEDKEKNFRYNSYT